MPHGSFEVILLPSTTVTATSAASGYLVLPDAYTAFVAKCTVTAKSGTSATLNMRIQRAMRTVGSGDTYNDKPTGALVWDDYAAFAQQTGTGTVYLSVVGSGEESYAAASGSLTAAQIRNGPLGAYWRAHYTIGGTGPSFTVNVIVQFIP